jgi:hypothetical protein
LKSARYICGVGVGVGVPTVPGREGAGLPGEQGWATVGVTEAGPFTPLAPLTELLTGGIAVAGVVPTPEGPVAGAVVVALVEDTGGGGTVTLDPVEPGTPGVVPLHGPATVLTTVGVRVVPVVPRVPGAGPGRVVVLCPGKVVAPGFVGVVTWPGALAG